MHHDEIPDTRQTDRREWEQLEPRLGWCTPRIGFVGAFMRCAL